MSRALMVGFLSVCSPEKTSPANGLLHAAALILAGQKTIPVIKSTTDFGSFGASG